MFELRSQIQRTIKTSSLSFPQTGDSVKGNDYFILLPVFCDIVFEQHTCRPKFLLVLVETNKAKLAGSAGVDLWGKASRVLFHLAEAKPHSNSQSLLGWDGDRKTVQCDPTPMLKWPEITTVLLMKATLEGKTCFGIQY